MNTLRQDIRFAIRSLAKARTTSLVAILCIALGIGANAAIFSVVRAVLLDALPYADPSRLVQMNEAYVHDGVLHTAGAVSPENLRDWRAQSGILGDAAGYTIATADLGGARGEPERVRVVRAMPNLFAVLGARPLRGRVFAAVDGSGDARAIVISAALWERHFGGDPAIVGSDVTLGGVKRTIAGVMPPSFDFPIGAAQTDVWSIIDPAMLRTTDRSAHMLQVVARLAPGVDSVKAMAGFEPMVRRLQREFPRWQTDRGLVVRGLAGAVVGTIRPALLVLLGAVGLVLLIACANVANLLLARASGRRREMAVRATLGASRGRLARQLLTESVLLAAAGGAAGLAFAYWLLAVLRVAAAGVLPRSGSIGVDLSVLVFALAASLVTGLVFGAAPALRAVRADLRVDLSDAAGGASTSAGGRRRMNMLVVGEVALSVVLLVGAGLVIRSFVALVDLDPGFDPDRVLTFKAAPPPGGEVADSGRYVRFYEPVLARLRALPGVRYAGGTDALPIQDGLADSYFTIIGRPPADPAHQPDAQERIVTSDYFHALGIRVLAGREFTEADAANGPVVAIVNDELARRYFPGESPIGKQIDGMNGAMGPATIIGVVRAVREAGLDRAAEPEFYYSAAQMGAHVGPMAFVVSTRGRPEVLAPAARAIVRSVAPGQPVYQLATMSTVIAKSVATRRLVLELLAGFAALALALAAAGVFGVMQYSVARRTREIGIRMSLGARQRDVMAMVLSDVAVVVGLGVVVGAAAAAVSSRLLQTILYSVGAHDPVTFALVLAVMALVGLLSGLAPSLRAARIDPLLAMRSE